jgi:TatD DNase family protein
LFLTDTHTHLYASEFDTDRKQVVESAIASGVKKFFLPNIDSTSVKGMLALCDQFPENCFPMMGLHPTSVKENYEEELEVVRKYLEERSPLQQSSSASLLQLEKVPEGRMRLRGVRGEAKFCAVGEIGIDLYWDKTFFPQQQLAFETQLKWANEFSLPIIIHSRNSFNEIVEVLQKNKNENPHGIFHCFSGSKEQAEKAISLGFKLGIGGVLTYKNSGLGQAIADIDMKHLVLETDSPYLTPVPHRGKRNESGYITLVAQKLAEIKNISVEEVGEITTANAIEVFGI